MMSKDDIEVFSLLNLVKVKGVAQKIMDSFPKLHFTQVKLFKNSPKLAAYLENYKKYYVLVFEVIDDDCFTQQYEDLKACLRPPFNMKLSSLIGNDLAGTYRQPPSPEFVFWDEWDFHLSTADRRDVIKDQSTSTDHFLDQAEKFDFVMLIENKELIDSNDGIRLDEDLGKLTDKISNISYSLKEFDSLDRIDELKLLKLKYENRLHDFLADNINLNKASNTDLSGEPAQATFIDKGALFQISFNGREVHISKSKGACSLHYLIERKGEYVSKKDIHALLNPSPPSDSLNFQKYSDPQINVGSTMHSEQSTRIDQKALEQYHSRINDLDEEIEEAELNNDQGTIAKLKGEKDLLIKEINAILHKDSPGYVKSIGKAIKRTIKKIEKEHKELGEHLSKSIKKFFGRNTGYLPYPDIDWRTK